MRLRPLLVAPLVGLVLAACSSSVLPTPAASVNGQEISRQSLEDELRLIQDDEGYRRLVEQQLGPLSGEGQGTLDADFVANLLNVRVLYELLEQLVDDAGDRVEDADLEASRTAIEQALGAGGVPELSDEIIDEQIRRDALVRAATRALAPVTDEEVEARYEEDPGAYAQACVSHILVGLEGRTEQEALQRAEELGAQLAAGTPFAELASTASDDQAAAARQGDLDCGPRGRFVAEFDEAAFSQAVGQVGPPVQTQFGSHLILVRERNVPGLEQARPAIEQELAAASEAEFTGALREASCSADVEVGSRYGEWDDSGCSEQQARVVPPTVRSPSTTAPTVPGAVAPEG